MSLNGSEPTAQAEYAANIEPHVVSPLRSHRDYERSVEAVCHHSGRYLARDEMYLQPLAFLYEQHEFAGHDALDAQFAKAAHAREHQHPVWNVPGVEGVSMAVAGGLLLVLAVPIWLRRNQVASLVEQSIFYLLLLGALVAGLLLLVLGLHAVTDRQRRFHELARRNNAQPSNPFFPLLNPSYELVGEEHYVVDLANNRVQQAAGVRGTGKIVVTVQADEATPASYASYRERYGTQVGSHFHAGVVALDKLQNIAPQGPLDLDHRIVLQGAMTDLLAPATHGASALIATFPCTYGVKPTAFGPQEDWRFPLECQPRLQEFSSYTLELLFLWHGAQPRTGMLDECRLRVPQELGPVRKVERGRYDSNSHEIVWTNLPLVADTNNGGPAALRVSATFSEPILRLQPVFTGTYRFAFSGLLSGLNLHSEHIWDARGLRVNGNQERRPIVRATSSINGSLTVATKQLLQEHEYIAEASATCDEPPEYDLVALVLQVLVEKNVDFQRIEQAAPRLDPSGDLQALLRYWDIIGRQYHPDRLTAVDVHVVISGYERIANLQEHSQPLPQTRLDLRVRCLHDPRDIDTPTMTAAVCDALIGGLEDAGIAGLTFDIETN